MAALHEWVEWDAEPGHVLLENGRAIDVQRGDELLMTMNEAGEVVFIDHKPLVLH